MKSDAQEELELQKNRLEILKMSGKNPISHEPDHSDENMYLWQYELEFHKKLKKREQFYFFGALCGISSLVLTIVFHWSAIVKLF